MEAAKAEMKARMAEAKLKQQQKLNQVHILVHALDPNFSSFNRVYDRSKH